MPEEKPDMEFLPIINTIFELAKKALDAGLLSWGKRKEARQQIEDEYNKFKQGITTESLKLERYLNFDKLIRSMAVAVNQILDLDTRVPGDGFWDLIDAPHTNLQNAVNPELSNFDFAYFNPKHQGQFNVSRPNLLREINESNALFRADRARYVERLRYADRYVREMDGTATQILGDTMRSLRAFGGS